jgi:hypothetical protein
MTEHVFKKGDRVTWLGKDMYLGFITEVRQTSGKKGPNVYPREVAEYDTDILTFIPVTGKDTSETRLPVTLREARGLIKTGAFKFKGEDNE